MTDGIVKDVEDHEIAQVKDEFRRIRGISPAAEVPPLLMKMYKRYEKQRSILAIAGPLHLIEKLTLNMIYDVLTERPETKAPEEEASPADAPYPPAEKQEEQEDDEAFEEMEVDETYKYGEGQKVSVEHSGTKMLGSFIEYADDEHKTAHVKINGDTLKFRKKKISEIKPFKE